MRRLRYQVAVSLDGFIAGPDDDASWIAMDPDIDFAALFAQFDTFLMGRRTWEVSGAMVGGGRSWSSRPRSIRSRTPRSRCSPMTSPPGSSR